MTIKLAKPFASYVTNRDLPRTGDSRKYELVFLYELEGTNRTGSRSWPWSYSGTHEAEDEKAGVDGLAERHKRALEAFERSIASELRTKGERLYSVAGQEMPVRGKA